MKKTIKTICLILLLASTAFAKSKPAEKLDIFLLRSNIASGQLVRLGDVAVVQGDAALRKMAEQIGLGLLSTPGQQMTIDKATVLARLASNGFDKKQINLVGSDSAVIRREQTVISSEKIIQTAEQFARKKLVDQNIAQLVSVTKPSDFVFDGNDANVRLVPELSSQRSGRVNVKVVVYKGDSVAETKTVSFNLKYKSKQLVAKKYISAGTLISQEDIRIQDVIVSRPSDVNLVSAVGKVARQRIDAGRVIKHNMLTDVKPKVAVKRNQLVEIRYETSVLLVTALGEALEDGTAGSLIKVANVKMNDKGKAIKGRVIVVKVQSDGTVTPVH